VPRPSAAACIHVSYAARPRRPSTPCGGGGAAILTRRPRDSPVEGDRAVESAPGRAGDQRLRLRACRHARRRPRGRRHPRARRPLPRRTPLPSPTHPPTLAPRSRHPSISCNACRPHSPARPAAHARLHSCDARPLLWLLQATAAAACASCASPRHPTAAAPRRRAPLAGRRQRRRQPRTNRPPRSSSPSSSRPCGCRRPTTPTGTTPSSARPSASAPRPSWTTRTSCCAAAPSRARTPSSCCWARPSKREVVGVCSIVRGRASGQRWIRCLS